MVVDYGVINFLNQNNSHSYNFAKFLICVEMVVEYGVINFLTKIIITVLIFLNS